jgi:ArsR family transcriptional regulator
VYALNDGTMPEHVRRVWTLLESGVADATLKTDRERCEALLKARARDLPWPDALAGEMEKHYSPGRTWDALARGLVGLLRLGDVLDAGAGDGAIAELVAPRAKTYTLLDRSERMLAAAQGGSRRRRTCASCTATCTRSRRRPRRSTRRSC